MYCDQGVALLLGMDPNGISLIIQTTTLLCLPLRRDPDITYGLPNEYDYIALFHKSKTLPIKMDGL